MVVEKSAAVCRLDSTGCNLLLFRRMVGITLLASLVGSQPATASCAMISDADEAATAAATESMHADHSGHGPASSESAPVHAHQHSDPATSCPVMMACTVAAPAVIGDDVPAASFSDESPVLAPVAAHASPSLAFEPPPPRQNLI